MDIFHALGFHWNRDAVPAEIPRHSRERVCFRFQKMLPEFVWDTSTLEGNPFTFVEIKTLLDGVTVGGRKISDHRSVLSLIDGSKYLLQLVHADRFRLDAATFVNMHAHASPADVSRSQPPHATLASSLAALQDLPAFEQALATALFGALRRPLPSANTRTALLMANGVLMSAGVDAISVAAANSQAFKDKMLRFRADRDGTELMEFLLDCHPDAQQIREAASSAPPPCRRPEQSGDPA